MTDTITELVDDLLAIPPASEAELSHRISGVDTEALRREVVDRAESGAMVLDDFGWVMALFGELGVGEQEGRLRAMLADESLDAELRQFAFLALSTDANIDLDGLATEAGEALGEMLAGGLDSLLIYAEDDPDVFLQVVEPLMESPEDEHASMFAFIDEQRQGLGLQAGLVYRDVLRAPRFKPLWPIVGAAIVEDGVVADAELLEAAASAADDAEMERELRRQTMKLRTAGIEANAEVAGFGLLGTCDGSGCYPVFAARERSDGSYAVINLLFRANGELRDGFATHFEDRDELRSVEETMYREAGAHFVEVSLPTIVALCREGLDLAQTHGGVPEEFADIAWRIRRLPADSSALVRPQAAPQEISLERTRELLAHPHHQYWFLDFAEFADAGVVVPEAEQPDEAWFEQALQKVGGVSDIVDHVVSLAENMARWHVLSGDAALAAVFARLAEQTREAPAQSPLMRVLVEKALAVREDAANSESFSDSVLAQAEDPILRREFRSRFFADVDDPSGYEVVQVSMMCVSYTILYALKPTIADRRQPRPEALYEIACDLGCLFADYLFGEEGVEAEDVSEHAAEYLVQAGLGPVDLTRVLPVFLSEVENFLNREAPEYFNQALDAPDEPMPDAFYR